MKFAMKPIHLFVMTIATTFLLSPYANAQGGHVGGGGAVVWWINKEKFEIDRAESLDLYEGREILKMRYNAVADYEDKVVEILRKVTEYQKTFGEQALAEAKKIMTSIREEQELQAPYVQLTTAPLNPVPDVLNYELPKDCINCTPEQAAVRLSDEQRVAYLGIQYSIQKHIWNKFDEISKTALVIHEAIYKVLNTPNSLAVRRIVRELLSADGFDFVGLTDALASSGYKRLIPTTEGSNHLADEVIKLDDDRILLQMNKHFTHRAGDPSSVSLQLPYGRDGKIIRKHSPGSGASNQKTVFNFHADLYARGLFTRVKRIATFSLTVNGKIQYFEKYRVNAVECKVANHTAGSVSLDLFDEIQIGIETKLPRFHLGHLSVNQFDVAQFVDVSPGIYYSGPFVKLLLPKLKID